MQISLLIKSIINKTIIYHSHLALFYRKKNLKGRILEKFKKIFISFKMRPSIEESEGHIRTELEPKTRRRRGYCNYFFIVQERKFKAYERYLGLIILINNGNLYQYHLGFVFFTN